MTPEPIPQTMLSIEQDRAWRHWQQLAKRAAETMTVDDAIASGKAFAKFHYLFVEPRQMGAILQFPTKTDGAA